MKAAAATKAKQAGNRRFHSGDFAEAQALYSLGIEYGDAIPPQLLAQLYSNRSATHLKLHQLDAAEADAKRATALAPQWGKPHLRLAEVYHAKCTYGKAVDELEIALGVGAAAQDDAVVTDAQAKMDEYRLLKDAEVRGESQNLAYSSVYMTEGAYKETMQASAGLRDDQDPSELLDKILKMKLSDGPGLDRHVLLGHQALRDGRYQDAVREFLAAAVNGNAEGMYNYAVMVEAGRGAKKNVGEAVHWLERAAQVPVQEEGPPNRNQGIGEAMSALARHHQLGIYFPMNSAKAVGLWQRAATLGSVAALNALGVLYAHGGSGGVTQNLALARDYLRQAAEKFSNEAMLNLADLHASLQQFDVAIRWADAAVRFGFAPAKEAVLKYRQLAAMRPAMAAVDPTILECLEETGSIARTAPPTVFRDREAPAVEDLRVIRTPYVRRLCLAKETMMDALSYFEDDEFVMSTAYAVEAHRIPDANLIFAPKEILMSHLVAQAMLENDVPLDAGLALLLQPPDPAAVVSFYGALHRQFPEEYTLAIRAACAHMFEGLAGSNTLAAVQLFDKAYALLPSPNDAADTFTLDYFSTAGPAHIHANNLPRAKSLLTQFVGAGTHDGHRKAPEAHFHLGMVEIAIAMKEGKAQQRKAIRIALDHLKAGRALAKTLPLFLQPSEPPRPERALANFVRMLSHALDVPIDLPTSGNDEARQHPLEGVLRGGEILNGPKCHEKLRRDRSRIVDALKKARVPIAKMMATHSGHIFKWTTEPPPKKPSKSQRKRSATATPATIDELFSALRDQVYEGRTLECIVVAPPCWSGSSHAVLVEDSQREPAIVAVYNASAHEASQLVPGRVLRIANPYVRIAADQSILIRVDDPSSALRIGDLHEICWNCSTVHAGATTSGLNHLQSCAKCHLAKYCSRECQKEDWREFGHRYLCK